MLDKIQKFTSGRSSWVSSQSLWMWRSHKSISLLSHHVSRYIQIIISVIDIHNFPWPPWRKCAILGSRSAIKTATASSLAPWTELHGERVPLWLCWFLQYGPFFFLRVYFLLFLDIITLRAGVNGSHNSIYNCWLGRRCNNSQQPASSLVEGLCFQTVWPHWGGSYGRC